MTREEAFEVVCRALEAGAFNDLYAEYMRVEACDETPVLRAMGERATALTGVCLDEEFVRWRSTTRRAHPLDDAMFALWEACR